MAKTNTTKSIPTGRAVLPGTHISVLFEGRAPPSDDHEPVWLTYYGTPDDLIAAGIATAETLAPGRVKGRKSIDADGDKYFFKHYHHWKAGVSEAYCSYRVRKPAGRLLGLREAVIEAERLRTYRADGQLSALGRAVTAASEVNDSDSEYVQRMHRLIEENIAARPVKVPAPGRTYLRLVVDNTRSAVHS
jgi:hypothetical protein